MDYSLLLKNFYCAHSLDIDYPDIGFHLHNEYEIYVFISGDVDYMVEQKKYPLVHGDVLLFNNKEIHKPTFLTRIPYERYVIQFNPLAIAPFHCANLDLLACFEQRGNGENNLIRLPQKRREQLLTLLNPMVDTWAGREPGYEILLLSQLLQLLYFLNQEYVSCIQASSISEPLAPPLSSIVAFIDKNLHQDLSLDTLQKLFYINKNYLCKLFKQQTGTTIHSYIVHKRVALAKQLLSAGHTVTETCQMCGFNDYANFIRTFKQMTGVSPARYKK